MNHLYIIGNGFDLAHGLKTSYREFILWYINKQLKFIVDSQNIEIKIDDYLIKLTRRSWGTSMEVSDSITDINSFKVKLEEMGKCTGQPFNIFYYYLLESIIEKDGWADIEKEYYSLMVKIISDDPKIRLDLDIKELNSSLKSLKREFEIYLIEKVFKGD